MKRFFDKNKNEITDAAWVCNERPFPTPPLPKTSPVEFAATFIIEAETNEEMEIKVQNFRNRI